MWANLSTTLNIQQDPISEVPVAILQNAVTAAGNGTMLNITWLYSTLDKFMVYLHFADFQNSKLREFDVYFNSDNPLPFSPQYLVSSSVYSSDWYTATNGLLNITLVATARSQLPPMLNAFEIYFPIIRGTPTTFYKDCKFVLPLGCDFFNRGAELPRLLSITRNVERPESTENPKMMNINHTTKTTSTGRLQTNLASGTILQN